MTKKNYTKTVTACVFGISNQAVITNITAVLFVHFMRLYEFELWQLGVLVGINFAMQMVADIILTFIIDRVGFRPLALIATAMSVLGLLFYGSLPFFVPSAAMFPAVIAATVVFAFSGGMCEVLLSPIIDNIPETAQSKGPAMSMMHSFYAWGQMFCIIVTALYLWLAGSENWGYIVMFFAIFPAAAFILFLRAPLDKKEVPKNADGTRKMLFSSFLFIALMAIMLGGASEVVMNQWVSTFLVMGLNLDKTIADLFGMSLFAMCIGIGRMLYGKYGDRWNLSAILAGSSIIACILYIVVGLSNQPILSLIASVVSGIFVSLLWPGTLTVSSRFFPMAGAWLFAVLAIFGDIGAMGAPVITGFLSETIGLKHSFLVMSVVPLGAFFCHMILMRKSKKQHISK